MNNVMRCLTNIGVQGDGVHLSEGVQLTEVF